MVFGRNLDNASFLLITNASFVNAHTCRHTRALLQRGEDQILRMEMAAGGETGGEWISAAKPDGSGSDTVETVGKG
jgi:hypothetical protein